MALLWASPKGLIPREILFLAYKPMIIPSISQCVTPSQQSSTILPSNKVHYRVSPEAYGALEQPPLNRGSTPFLESSNKVNPLFDTLVTFDCTFEAHNTLFDI